MINGNLTGRFCKTSRFFRVNNQFSVKANFQRVLACWHALSSSFNAGTAGESVPVVRFCDGHWTCKSCGEEGEALEKEVHA